MERAQRQEAGNETQASTGAGKSGIQTTPVVPTALLRPNQVSCGASLPHSQAMQHLSPTVLQLRSEFLHITTVPCAPIAAMATLPIVEMVQNITQAIFILLLHTCVSQHTTFNVL